MSRFAWADSDIQPTPTSGLKELVEKHLKGQHDQSKHGRRGGKGGSNISRDQGASTTPAPILKEEERLATLTDHEEAALFTPEGELLFRKAGEASKVRYDWDQERKMNGAVLTHNHPGGTSFSQQDVVFSYQVNLAEARVVTRDKTYVMRPPERGWSRGELTREYLNEDWNNISWNIHQKKGSVTNHEIMEGMAESGWFRYSVEDRAKTKSLVEKFNPNHDSRGRFARAGSGKGGSANISRERRGALPMNKDAQEVYANFAALEDASIEARRDYVFDRYIKSEPGYSSASKEEFNAAVDRLADAVASRAQTVVECHSERANNYVEQGRMSILNRQNPRGDIKGLSYNEVRKQAEEDMGYSKTQPVYGHHTLPGYWAGYGDTKLVIDRDRVPHNTYTLGDSFGININGVLRGRDKETLSHYPVVTEKRADKLLALDLLTEHFQMSLGGRGTRDIDKLTGEVRAGTQNRFLRPHSDYLEAQIATPNNRITMDMVKEIRVASSYAKGMWEGALDRSPFAGKISVVYDRE